MQFSFPCAQPSITEKCPSSDLLTERTSSARSQCEPPPAARGGERLCFLCCHTAGTLAFCGCIAEEGDNRTRATHDRQDTCRAWAEALACPCRTGASQHACGRSWPDVALTFRRKTTSWRWPCHWAGRTMSMVPSGQTSDCSCRPRGRYGPRHALTLVESAASGIRPANDASQVPTCHALQ